ncbi:conjugal transfer protein TraH [Alteromonas macleodii]|uniref:Conjugative relaxosome accessory transposon family protein n=1 Tax=Alteromonas macleodii TaxID=28108 RepID=A0AB36FL58_ALTMA|nr:conjugal transfer protein TraH [Alteromonas macleodii]OES24225.1 conjugative relaxosome accessory transposon family protein [Alteromonas macleodii]OES24856.1 conjugative relaxosome accessory transposon family protein [Alteromonas macleodii]OES25134.1 conjugative relaxosome accessory transposon family protein [Alteromonas macleodii]OES39176.1 conjugative relaxosome accessory transposon family protein [Alteromonas macleodii]
MKRSILTLTLATLLSSAPTVVNATDWTQNWYDNAVVTRPSSFQSQQRGFYTLGGFQARIDVTADNLMAISLPYIESGCGGIDAFFGGMSFLDADYIVQKLENIMQAAPYVAFQMALKTLSHQLSDTITDATAIADFLNSIQIDECAIAEGAVQTVVDITDGKGFSTAHDNMLANAYNRELLDKALKRHRQETSEDLNANDKNPDQDISDATAACPALVDDLFANGSFVDNITTLYGYDLFEDIIRGMVGDFFINRVNGVIRPDEVSACTENVDYDIDDVVYGRLLSKTQAGVCVAGTQANIFGIVTANLNDITTALTNGDDIAVTYPQAVNFIEQSPLPVIPTLRAAVIESNEAIMSDMLREPISYGFAYRIYKNLNSHLTVALYDALQNMENISEDGCDMSIYEPVIYQAAKIQNQLLLHSKALDDGYRLKLEEFRNMLDIVEILRRRDDVEMRKARTKL